MDYRERWELKDYLVGRELARRILLFRIAVGLILVGFVLNFWYLQGVRGQDYAQLAETNRLRRIPALPTRGVIFDRSGAVIASTRPSLDLVLLREGAADREAQLRALAPILDTTYDALVARLDDMRARPAYEPLVLVEDVALEQLARVEARREKFPSIEVRETSRRSYPHGGLLAQVMGYVGEASEKQLVSGTELQGGDIVGKSGLERGYDETLRGRRGWDLVSVNNLGRPVGDAWVGRPPEHGEDVQLTLDVRVQRALDAAFGDESGAGVFLDPWSGEVLALVSKPSFDPSLFADGMSAEDWKQLVDDPRRPLLDRAIGSSYAPGSVFKILMAIAGLETGTIRASDVVQCDGSIKFYKRARLCWKRGGHGPVDLRRALAHSCNVYFYKLGREMGIDAIHEYGDRFNLGKSTGIDLPGEDPGLLPSREWKRRNYKEVWYPGDTISVAIGQGFLEGTPLQMASLVGAVATDGIWARPHLLQGLPPELRAINVDPEHFRIVRSALQDAVEQGTGTAAALEGVTVAGKTGTAQIIRRSAGIDSDELPKHERDHAWFAGYAPADHPAIAFAVVVEHGGHGGSTAAPIVRETLRAFFFPGDEADDGSPEGATLAEEVVDVDATTDG